MRSVWYALAGGVAGFTLGFITFWAWWSWGVGGWIPFRQFDEGILWPFSAGCLVGTMGAFGSVRFLDRHSGTG